MCTGCPKSNLQKLLNYLHYPYKSNDWLHQVFVTKWRLTVILTAFICSVLTTIQIVSTFTARIRHFGILVANFKDFFGANWFTDCRDFFVMECLECGRCAEKISLTTNA